MAVVSSSYLIHSRIQSGALLMEAMVVVGIIGILAAVALPSMRETLLKGDLESGQETMATTFDRARALAKSQNTFITISPNGSIVTLKSSNGKPDQFVNLPDRAQIKPIPDIVFSPTGTLSEDRIEVWVIPRQGDDGKHGRKVVLTRLGTATVDRTATDPSAK